MLKKPELREIYDKQEDFVKAKKMSKKPTPGVRYFAAFQELSFYSIFVLMTLMMVQSH